MRLPSSIMMICVRHIVANGADTSSTGGSMGRKNQEPREREYREATGSHFTRRKSMVDGISYC